MAQEADYRPYDPTDNDEAKISRGIAMSASHVAVFSLAKSPVAGRAVSHR